MFTVYGPFSLEGSKSFDSLNDAWAFARRMQAVTGGEYECRDANFDHVFTIED